MTADTTHEALYAQALEIVAEKASHSYLQRKLRCSYNEAEALLERMVAQGVITTYSGRRTSKPAPDEMSPNFTDTARAALLWVLWHHQGASSPVGQPIRFALGMGQHDRLNDHQLREAKRWEALHPVNPSAWAQGVRPLTTEQIESAWDQCGGGDAYTTFQNGMRAGWDAAHGITGATDACRAGSHRGWMRAAVCGSAAQILHERTPNEP